MMRKRFLSDGIADRLNDTHRVFQCIFKAQDFVRYMNRANTFGGHYHIEAAFRKSSGEFLGFLPCRDNEEGGI